MDMLALKAKIMQSRWAVALWLVLALIGLAALIRNVLFWNGWFSDMVISAIIAKPTPSTVQVKGWLFWIIAGLVSCLVVCSGLLIRSEINLAKSLTIQDERKTIAFKTMQGMMVAAARIRDQHQPSATKVKKSVRKCRTNVSHSQEFQCGCRTEMGLLLHRRAG
jgi:hypothetical protein